MRRSFIATLLIMTGLPWIACSRQQPTAAQQQVAPQSQNSPQHPEAARQNLPPAANQEAALQTIEGDLSRVDSQKQLIWIKTPDGKQMQFSFNNNTLVEGADRSVEGLAKMSGTHLTIDYMTEGGMNMASRIEIQDQGFQKAPNPTIDQSPTITPEQGPSREQAPSGGQNPNTQKTPREIVP